MRTFEELGVNEPLRKAIAELGFEMRSVCLSYNV